MTLILSEFLTSHAQSACRQISERPKLVSSRLDQPFYVAVKATAKCAHATFRKPLIIHLTGLPSVPLAQLSVEGSAATPSHKPALGRNGTSDHADLKEAGEESREGTLRQPAWVCPDCCGSIHLSVRTSEGGWEQSICKGSDLSASSQAHPLLPEPGPLGGMLHSKSR